MSSLRFRPVPQPTLSRYYFLSCHGPTIQARKNNYLPSVNATRISLVMEDIQLQSRRAEVCTKQPDKKCICTCGLCLASLSWTWSRLENINVKWQYTTVISPVCKREASKQNQAEVLQNDPGMNKFSKKLERDVFFEEFPTASFFLTCFIFQTKKNDSRILQVGFRVWV